MTLFGNDKSGGAGEVVGAKQEAKEQRQQNQFGSLNEAPQMPASNCEQQLINQAQLIGGQLYGLGRRQPIGKRRVDYVVCQNLL